ncbi:dihydroneopterin aldolase [Chitinophaga sp.]|uniref:dihydroneopterin aldolase n=1 Tax=Chitinophaga sp. TaxID=1869181 RepID=UPI00262241B4|nr:dihydroneopterin aldolase [uncultured Chitinophaga sp.]
MLTIALESVRFFAHHGFYEEERIIGNHFLLDVLVQLPEPEHPSHLAESVNYEALFSISKEVMEVPQALLEQVVHDISEKVKARFPVIRYSKVTLRKQAPPFGGDLAWSCVALEKQY